MKRARTGRYETTTFSGESVKAFIPHPLPPDPPLDLKNLHIPLEQALLALGRHSGLGFDRVLGVVGVRRQDQ